MTELAVALSRKDYTEARKRFAEVWSSAEEQNADYVAEIKTEISAQLAAELKRHLSTKARQNLRMLMALTSQPMQATATRYNSNFHSVPVAMWRYFCKESI